MYRVDENNRNGVLADLISSRVASVLEPGDDRYTQIMTMESSFRPIGRNPETIRIMTQLEFNYEGVVDGSDKLLLDNMNPLHHKCEWFDSTFAVANYSSVEAWCKKASEEAAKGKTIVLLLPARTNTAWFHQYVFGHAREVRFVKGIVSLTGSAKPNTFPDCVAVFAPGGRGTEVPRSERPVAILNLRTSFTTTDHELSVDFEDDRHQTQGDET